MQGRLESVSALLWGDHHQQQQQHHHHDVLLSPRLLLHRHHDLLLSAGDGCLLRRRGLWLRRHAGMSPVPGSNSALSIGHDLYGDGSIDVRLHRRVDPVRRSEVERPHVQLLQVGHLPTWDDLRRGAEGRLVRFRLRLPLKDSGGDGLQPGGASSFARLPSAAASTCRASKADDVLVYALPGAVV